MEPTPPNPTGPAWRRGAPFRERLVPEGYRRGRPLRLGGRVRDIGGAPVADAVLDVWHASPWGLYDMLSQEMRFRGKVRTDAAGGWAVETVVPAGYLWRPRHVHFRVLRHDRELLVSQLYLGRDVRQRIDPHVEPLLIVPLVPEGRGCRATYDIVLDLRP